MHLCIKFWKLTIRFVFFQPLVTTATQSPIVIAPQPSALKPAATLTTSGPVTCGDVSKVGHLVSSTYKCSSAAEHGSILAIGEPFNQAFFFFLTVVEPQQVVSSEEGINLEEIREFAKNFKIRRLSLGLTQTQVGQALTATEGPAYSQSAICRYII